MEPNTLTFFGLLVLPFINWPVAFMLIRLARIKPHIRALTERAILAVVIAVVTTIYVFVAANTQGGFFVLSQGEALTLLRLTIIGFGLYPAWWLWTYYRGDFGSGEGDDDLDDAA